MELKDSNKIIYFSKTKRYFIIQLIGDKLRSLDHHQAIFTRNSKMGYM